MAVDTLPDLLTLTTPVDLQAADASKPARVSITAYTGGEMVVGGFGTIAIEANAVDLGSSIPLLSDHDATRGGVVGSGTARVTTGGRIEVIGTISRASAAGAEIIALAKDGVPWQASVGLSPDRDKLENIRPGESATVNGRTIRAGQSGLTVVRGGRLREVSIVATGADSQTSVQIAAKNPKGNVMSDITTQAPNEPTESVDAIRAAAANEYRRHAEVAAIAVGHPEIAATAIEKGWSKAETEVAVLKAQAKRNAVISKVRGGSGSEFGTSPQHLEASLLLRGGHEDVAVKAFGEVIVSQAADMRIRSLVDLCRAAVDMDGRQLIDRNDTDERIIKAAFSTVTLPNILSNTMGRALESAYMEATSEILQVATIKSAASFKDQKDVRPSALQNLEQVGPGGIIKHASIKEEDTYDWSVDTYAKMVGVTRRDIINDDLGFVDTLPQMLATAAARSLLDLFFSTLMAGQTSGHFASGNNNLLEASSALSVGTLGTGVRTMKNQRDSAGNSLVIRPQALVVPTTLEWTARPILSSAELLGPTTASTPSGNPANNAIPQLIVAPQLENSDKYTGSSTTAWYLLGGPMTSAILVGFLNGQRSPTIDIEEADFNKLGIQMRVYHDYGVALGDEKAALKATGAA